MSNTPNEQGIFVIVDGANPFVIGIWQKQQMNVESLLWKHLAAHSWKFYNQISAHDSVNLSLEDDTLICFKSPFIGQFINILVYTIMFDYKEIETNQWKGCYDIINNHTQRRRIFSPWKPQTKKNTHSRSITLDRSSQGMVNPTTHMTTLANLGTLQWSLSIP